MLPTVAVYGLGRLGLPLVSVLVNSQFHVVGVDSSAHRLDEIKAHADLVEWPEEGCMNLPAADYSLTPVPADISFIIVPTPSNPNGSFSSDFVDQALRDISAANRDGRIAVVVSTVSPRTMDQMAERYPNLSLVYNPTFIALGDVVRGLTHPDMLIIGGEHQDTSEVKAVWKQVFRSYGGGLSPHIHEGSFVEIELMKLTINAMLGTKISLANSIGELYEAYGVPKESVALCGLDHRIGSAYLMPGSPITGPCLPRDNRALLFAGAVKGVKLPLAEATDEINGAMLRSSYVGIMSSSPRTVGVLGISYKHGVGVDTGSAGKWLADEIESKNPHVTVKRYDELLPSDELNEVQACDVIICTQRELAQHVEREGVTAKVFHLWS